MDETKFDGNVWVVRLAAAIDEDVSRSDPPRLDYPGRPPLESAGGDRVWRLAQYRGLARRAKTDPVAAQLFAESRVRFGFDPVKTKSILREHPVLAGADVDSAELGGVCLRLANRTSRLDFDSLLPRLAKISLVEGADGAASLLYRFLTDGEAGLLPATEIIVVHGLSLGDRVELPEGVTLAPYGDTRQKYGLPEDPVAWLKSGLVDLGRWNRSTATAAPVRPIAWHPGFSASTHATDNAFEFVAYGFPPGHAVESLDALFQDRSLLVDFLSIVVGTRLVSHT